ncbi:MAG: MFS transporter [Omnitrophica WOR_2 bacterium]
MSQSTKIDIQLRAGTQSKAIILIYVLVSFFYWVGLYLYVPTLPLYVQARTNNLTAVGVVLSMYGLWQLIIRLPLGIAVDWAGWKKPFLAGGIALVGVGAWIMGSASSESGLIVGRAVTGLAAGAWVPLTVVFSGLFDRREILRATALLTLISTLARLVATSATGFLNNLGGYSLAFHLSAFVSALAVLIVLFVPEQPLPVRKPQGMKTLALLVRRDVLLPALLNAICQYGDWAATFSFVPILARQFGAGDITISWMLSANIGLVLLGNLVVTSVVNRIGYPKLVIAGFLLIAAGILGAALTKSMPYLFLAQFSIGLASGALYPVLMGLSIRSVGEPERTTAMGLHQSVYALGMFGGPWLSGILAASIGIQPMFAITAVGIVVLASIVIRAMK